MGPRSSRFAFPVVLLIVSACGEEGPPPSLVADLGMLHAIVDQDPAVEALEIVDRVVDDERPVHAAQVLRETAIPAAQSQVEIVEAANLRTEEGRRFARRLAVAYRARVSALDTYRSVLEGGVSADPMETLDAIRGRREAEQQLLRVIEAMVRVAPPAPSPPAADREEVEGEAPLEGPPR